MAKLYKVYDVSSRGPFNIVELEGKISLAKTNGEYSVRLRQQVGGRGRKAGPACYFPRGAKRISEFCRVLWRYIGAGSVY